MNVSTSTIMLSVELFINTLMTRYKFFNPPPWGPNYFTSIVEDAYIHINSYNY
jgi:hypothetical protein